MQLEMRLATGSRLSAGIRVARMEPGWHRSWLSGVIVVVNQEVSTMTRYARYMAFTRLLG